jgi:prolyl oligopeptidase
LAEVDGVRPEHHDKRLPDEIRFVKFSSITWTHDSKGFFYQVCLIYHSSKVRCQYFARLQRYPDRESHGLATEDKAGTETQCDVNAMIYYHKIGTSQCECGVILV